MAGGQAVQPKLVPHQLPSGQWVNVPDYLLPAQQAGAAPIPPMAPMPGSPNRLATGPSSAQANPTATDATKWGPADEPPDMSSFQTPAAIRSALMPQQSKAPAPTANEHKRQPGKFEQLDSLGKAPAGADKADPSELARGRKKPEQAQGVGGSDPNGGMDPLVRAVFNEGPRGGGGPRRSGGMEVGTIKTERTPGREFLPEQLWNMGLAERPDLGEELDPDAEQPTWGNADPVMRKRQTAIERGSEQEGSFARQQFDLQERDRQEFGIAQKAALLEQSEALDSQLSAVAERRKRVAQLQETAERRMQEAESMEPRTRGEIWESRGNLARGTAMLAAVLSGAAAGLQGRTGSPAWDVIEKSIDEDVQADRYKAERRTKLGLEAKNDYERAVGLYGDLDVAALEVKQRKTANMLATLQHQLADRSLDESAKMRGIQVYEAGKAKYLERAQLMNEMLTGVDTKQEINYKQAPATGGGAGLDTLARLERAARAKKALNTVTGEDEKPKVNPTEAADLNAQEAGLAPLKSLLQRYKGADQIPGIAGKNVVSRGARGVLDFVGGEGSGSGALDSDEERANAMVVDRARLAYKNAVTGAGGSDTEAAVIDKAFAGARTKADLDNAVRISEQTIAERRRLSGGGASNAKAPTQAAESFRTE